MSVYPDFTPAAGPPNPFRIRSSRGILPQLLYNEHLRDALRTAHSKGLTAFQILPQVIYNQHLPELFGTAEDKELMTPLKSALAEESPVTPLECAVPESRGGGVLSLN